MWTRCTIEFGTCHRPQWLGKLRLISRSPLRAAGSRTFRKSDSERERHVELAKMHERAEYNGKQHGVDQGVHEAVVEFDDAPDRVDRKYDGGGDEDRHELIHIISLSASRLNNTSLLIAFPRRAQGCFSFFAARMPLASATCSHMYAPAFVLP